MEPHTLKEALKTYPLKQPHKQGPARFQRYVFQGGALPRLNPYCPWWFIESGDNNPWAPPIGRVVCHLTLAS